jgi:hypothetical protein
MPRLDQRHMRGMWLLVKSSVCSKRVCCRQSFETNARREGATVI